MGHEKLFQILTSYIEEGQVDDGSKKEPLSEPSSFFQEETQKKISGLNKEIESLKKALKDEDKQALAEAYPPLLKEIFSTEAKFFSSLKTMLNFTRFLKKPELFLDKFDSKEALESKEIIPLEAFLEAGREEENPWVFVSEETWLSRREKKLLDEVEELLERLIEASSALVKPGIKEGSSLPEFDPKKEPDLEAFLSFYSPASLEKYFEVLIDYSKLYQQATFRKLVSRLTPVDVLKDASKNRMESLAVQPIQRGPRHQLLLRGLEEKLLKKAPDSNSTKLIGKMAELVISWMALLNQAG